MGGFLRQRPAWLGRTVLSWAVGGVLFLGVPVPVLAATGLAVPLPTGIYRMAVRLATSADTVIGSVATLSLPKSHAHERVVVTAEIVATPAERALAAVAPRTSPAKPQLARVKHHRHAGTTPPSGMQLVADRSTASAGPQALHTSGATAPDASAPASGTDGQPPAAPSNAAPAAPGPAPNPPAPAPPAPAPPAQPTSTTTTTTPTPPAPPSPPGDGSGSPPPPHPAGGPVPEPSPAPTPAPAPPPTPAPAPAPSPTPPPPAAPGDSGDGNGNGNGGKNDGGGNKGGNGEHGRDHNGGDQGSH